MPQEDNLKSLVDIVARLRGPDGCPWDRQQTHRSLREGFLQEFYEVIFALDAGDVAALREELGDLLLHIVLQAQIGAEAGEFEIKDVIGDICEKLVHRHPHVFGSEEVSDAEDVVRRWGSQKRKERGSERSVLDGVPVEMPALGYSQEIQGRAAQAGFDWPSDDDDAVINKLAEEVGEFRQVEGLERQAEEFGDMLFTLANIARRRGIDLESALRETNQRFYRRFNRMEEACRQRDVDFTDLSFAEQNELWEEAKRGSDV